VECDSSHRIEMGGRKEIVLTRACTYGILYEHKKDMIMELQNVEPTAFGYLVTIATSCQAEQNSLWDILSAKVDDPLAMTKYGFDVGVIISALTKKNDSIIVYIERGSYDNFANNNID